jgi:N-acetylglucosaminyldiphosphoundecaprenol N-acetyl-beta-D-mannosaminyltransferase
MISTKKIKILDIYVDRVTTNDVLNKIRDYLRSSDEHYIVTPNPEFLITAQKDKEFKKILNSADIAIADGIGLLWAAKFLSIPTSRWLSVRIFQSLIQFVYTELSLVFYPKYCRSVLLERVAGSDLVWKISQLAEQENSSIYLLGAEKGVAKECGRKLKQRYPKLRITGAQSGSPKKEFDDKIVEEINRVKPDILFVAYGAPKQEKWIARNLEKLGSVKLTMGVGGAFDFIVGKVRRAPKILRNLGLEWVYRLFREPWRLKRIYNASCKFPCLVLRSKLRKT